jgi:alpha-tubulin suppressor-like RCC1 family protein
MSCGAEHSLVLTNCGEVYAWGRNISGQIGNGCNDHYNIEDSNVPKFVAVIDENKCNVFIEIYCY